ncbi:hypothetical protein [Streptomyces sp. NBC_00316]|uniref:hypothetical protein n=1 Tax=Streptomyces sp. NBC_00316 TaxID=2975710 RepID=UPI003FA7DBBD
MPSRRSSAAHLRRTGDRFEFTEITDELRQLFPALTTKPCQRVGTRATANNVEIAYTPTNSAWLNRIEAQFTALRYFTLDDTDHADRKEQGSMIRRYVI